MLTAWTYATEADAQRAIDAIDAARGPTEVLTRDGVPSTVARLTWAHPLPLRDGTYAVPSKGRLSAVSDVPVTVDGAPTRTPRESDARTIADDEPTRDADAGAGAARVR